MLSMSEEKPISGEEPMSDRDPELDHLFKTNIAREKFEAVLARSCKAPFTYEVVAADPRTVPQERVYAVAFTSLPDRDRVRIAMRFVEKEVAAAARDVNPNSIIAATRRTAPASV